MDNRIVFYIDVDSENLEIECIEYKKLVERLANHSIEITDIATFELLENKMLSMSPVFCEEEEDALELLKTLKELP